jgi:hydrogenase/urease accessory protein HupE
MMRLFRLLLMVGLLGSAGAHEIEQVFFRMSLGEEEWSGVVELDALMLLETAAGGEGKTEEDGTNKWFAELSEERVKEFFEETEGYWRKRFVMKVGGVTCPYDLSLPDPVKLQKDVAGSPQEGTLIRLTATGSYPDASGDLEVRWEDPELPYLVVGFRGQGEETGTTIEPVEYGYTVKLGTREQSEDAAVVVVESPSLWGWVKSGFEHILPKGLDHIAFVLGLFLLVPRWKPLLAQSAVFTVAHSLSLGMVVMGVFSVSGDVVEPLIALSIVYVAVENLFLKELKPWRLVLIFAFGLLHGMGFAGVMQELDLPEGEILRPLLGFNVGVELGQVAVFALGFLLVGWWLGNEECWKKIRRGGSLIIAVMGLYWTVERILL